MKLGIYLVAAAVGGMVAFHITKVDANPYEKIAYCSMVGEVSAAVQEDRHRYGMLWYDYADTIKKQMHDSISRDKLLEISLSVYSSYSQSDSARYVGAEEFKYCMEVEENPQI